MANMTIGPGATESINYPNVVGDICREKSETTGKVSVKDSATTADALWPHNAFEDPQDHWTLLFLDCLARKSF